MNEVEGKFISVSQLTIQTSGNTDYFVINKNSIAFRYSQMNKSILLEKIRILLQSI